jgi:hypothetical protein
LIIGLIGLSSDFSPEYAGCAGSCSSH